MARIAVILNPYAGQNRSEASRAERLARVLGARGTVYAPDGLPELEEAIDRALNQQPEVLALCGGDGSYFRAFTILQRKLPGDTWPPILALPAGTINNLTHAIRTPTQSPERLLGLVLSNLEHGMTPEIVDCDLFTIGEEQVGYIFGAGMIVNFLRAYYARRPDPGPGTAAWLLARMIASSTVRGKLQRRIFQPFEADVVCDGQRVPHRQYRTLIVGSMNALGLGFSPFYLAGRKPGQFHVLGGPARASRLVSHLMRYYRGFPAYDPEMYDNLSAELIVEFARPAYYTVNGDLLGPTMRIELRKLRRISLIRG